MKFCFVILLFFSGIINAQNKKELDQRIDVMESRLASIDSHMVSLKTRNISFENELRTINTTLSSTSTSINLLLKSITALEKHLEELYLKYSSLQTQYDSLRQIQMTTNTNSTLQTPIPIFELPPVTTGDTIRQVVNNYLKASSIADKKNYILNPEITAPLMKKYYSNEGPKGAVSVEQIILVDSVGKPGQHYIAKTVCGYNNSIGTGFYNEEVVFVRVKEGYKVDWEASEGYNKTSLVSFKSDINLSEVVVKVSARIGNYFNYNYRDKNIEYINLGIEDNKGHGIMGCYALRNSDAGKSLYKILKDGERHRITIRIKKDPSRDKSGDTVIVTNFVAGNWYEGLK